MTTRRRLSPVEQAQFLRALDVIEQTFPGTTVLLTRDRKHFIVDTSGPDWPGPGQEVPVGLFDSPSHDLNVWMDIDASVIGTAVQICTARKCSVIFGRTMHGGSVITITAPDRDQIKRFPASHEEASEILEALNGNEFVKWAVRHQLSD